MSRDSVQIYRLRVELMAVADIVWRIVEVPRDLPLDVLGEVIEAAFGWDDSMGFEFRPEDGPWYVDPWMIEDEDEDELSSYRGATIDQMLGEVDDNLPFMYGVGKDWYHEVELLDVREPEQGAVYPRCTGGRGCCPRAGEGYAADKWDYLYDAFCDDEHEDHEKAVSYIGADYVPEPFDEDDANLRIRMKASAVWAVYTAPVPGSDLEAVVCEDAWTGRVVLVDAAAGSDVEGAAVDLVEGAFWNRALTPPFRVLAEERLAPALGKALRESTRVEARPASGLRDDGRAREVGELAGGILDQVRGVGAYLDIEGVTQRDVELFFMATAGLSAWRVFRSIKPHMVFEVGLEPHAPGSLLTVLGHNCGRRGLVLLERYEDFYAMGGTAGTGLPHPLSGTLEGPVCVLHMVGAGELPGKVRSEIEARGWSVADEDSYPRLVVLEDDVTRSPTALELRRVTLAALGMGAMLEEQEVLLDWVACSFAGHVEELDRTVELTYPHPDFYRELPCHEVDEDFDAKEHEAQIERAIAGVGWLQKKHEVAYRKDVMQGLVEMFRKKGIEGAENVEYLLRAALGEMGVEEGEEMESEVKAFMRHYGK